MKSIQLLIAVLVGGAASLASAGLVTRLSGMLTSDPYVEINSQLEKQVPTEVAQENFEFIRTLQMSSTGADRKTREALDDLLSLERLRDDAICDSQSMALLDKIKGQVGVGSFNVVSSRPKRRIDIIIFDSFIEHVRSCRDVYRKQLWAAINSSLSKGLRNLIEDLIWTRLTYADGVNRPGNGNYYMTYTKLLDYNMLMNRLGNGVQSFDHMGPSLVRFMREEARYDPDGIYLDKVSEPDGSRPRLHKDKIAQLVDRLIVRPCKDLVSSFDLSVPMRDLKFQVSSDFYADKKYHFDRHENAEFILPIGIHQICGYIANKPRPITKKLIAQLE